ncbi:MAG: hypothetical protein M1830_000964 [Pleopsidium flavum]|nr:MAG: hypothetical protein M1830_000964 [Pleopsidium flavum]
MPPSGRMFAGDEELGKKYDDHRPSNGNALPFSWLVWRTPMRVRKRRLLFALFALLALYFFVKYIPTDLGPVPNRQRPVGGRPPAGHPIPPIGRPPRDDVQTEVEKHYFSGPIRFYKLASSLQAVSDTMGHGPNNKNVLFAASNMQSASVMIPMACEMARWRRNSVHFVVMGRNDISIDSIKEVNGVTAECDVYWHDGRPDYSSWSSDFRMEVSVTAAFKHMNSFVHPQVIIADYPLREDAFLTNGVRNKAQELGTPLIELPSDGPEKLMWMTRLDSGSLRAWHKASVDLLIHAPPKASGSLIRLLRSIEKADYFGSNRPRVTIELPSEVDPPTQHFLENLVWPPADGSGRPHVNQVTLRHRISRQSITSEEASVRLVESFYPKSASDSHVLLLDPQTELSPLYYHYLKYHLLEYGYSSYGSQDPHNLLGISLELPSFHLNDSAPFSPPLSSPSPFARTSFKPDQPTSFLWQAPNSHATLYFGDKWVEFHSFLGKRLEAHHSPSPLAKPPPKRTKLISEKYPSWMEYLLEFMRVRGYSLLYPNFDFSEAIVTVHNELYQPPEEFYASNPPSSLFNTTITPPDPYDPFTADPSIHPLTTKQTTPEPPLLTTSLLSILPTDGDLPELTTIPLLSYAGDTITSADSTTLATFFAARFKSEIGGCTGSGVEKHRRPMSAGDLFCLVGDEEDEGVEVAAEGGSDGLFMGTSSLSSLSAMGSSTSLAAGAVETAPFVVPA